MMRVRTIVGALAVAVSALSCTKAEQAVPSGIAWNHDFEATLAEARTSRRPILLDFYTDW